MLIKQSSCARTFRAKVWMGVILIAGAAIWFVPSALQAGPDSAMQQAGQLQPPDIVALRMHADWCGACKQLSPMYAKLLERTTELPVLHLTFDVTDNNTRRQADYLAALLGLEQLCSDQTKQVGTIVLLDAGSKQVISTVAASGNIKSIEAAVRGALKAARGT